MTGTKPACLMKTYSKIIFAATVAALGLVSCSREELAPVEKPQGNPMTVHFGAKSHVEVTRATLTTEDEATFASAWEDGDVLSVYYITPDFEDATVPATWVASSSSFEAAITGSKGEWIYDALYPAPTSENKVDFGSKRTQKGSTYSSKYDLMKGSAAFENADAGKDDAGNDVVFEMDRQTGIVYFHISGDLNEDLVSATLSVEGGSIAKSEVAVTKDNSGNITYAKGFDLTEPDLKDITISFADGTAPKSSDFKLWFNVIPTAYTSMSLMVETTGHKLTINNSTAGSYAAGKLYKVVKEISAEKWISTIPVYASLSELIAAGEPTEAGTQVTVTLKDEVIRTFTNTKGVNLLVGNQSIQIYCASTAFPTDWTEGGTISGTLTNCKWVLYGGSTWELCPENWEELTYTAPLESCETPVITLDGAEATITCATDGSTIHYTVGESPADPTESDAVYSVPVTLTDGQTIKAIAIKDGMKPSAVASKKYKTGSNDVVVLSEEFDNSKTSDSTTAIDKTTFPNFSGATNKAYTSKYGGLKLGSSNAAGYITSKSLDLSKPFTVSLNAMQYNEKDGAKIQITVEKVVKEITISADDNVYTVDFDAATSTSTVKIGTSTKRAYIDNVIITRHD